MDKKSALYIFIGTLRLLLDITQLLKDEFFLKKIDKKLETLVFDYLSLLNADQGDDFVFQSVVIKVTSDIDSLLEALNDLYHLGLLEQTPLFLEIHKHFLELKLETLKQWRILSRTKPLTVIAEDKKLFKAKTTPPIIVKKDSKLNQSKKSILDFIKSFPNSRTKDIINEFNALSDRTVKRNLINLLRNGLIKKKVDNKAVYYYVD